MKKEIKIVHETDVEPTIFETRESKRLITKEREGCERLSFHIIKGWAFGKRGPVSYPDNDEILYMLEGDTTIFWKDKMAPLKPGTAVYIPAGCEYYMLNRSTYKIIAVLSPPRLREEWRGRKDLVKLESLGSSEGS